MTLTFLGTRGYIDARSRRHRRHSTLAISHRDRVLLIDCGEDWRGSLERLQPTAILITHAHPDHAAGLVDGAPCPVWATREVWSGLPALPHLQRRILLPRKVRRVAGLSIRAFPVAHSIRAPAVGYRVAGGGACFFYVPDVVAIPRERQALFGVDLYIGDGASVTRPILRRRNGIRIGHVSVREQLTWCARQHVTRAIFTHCGSQIVTGDERRLGASIGELGRALGIEARIAYDGLRIALRQRPRRARGSRERPRGADDQGGPPAPDPRS